MSLRDWWPFNRRKGERRIRHRNAAQNWPDRRWLGERRAHTYYTTDGHRLAPYPGMTDRQLDDFEQWADAL